MVGKPATAAFALYPTTAALATCAALGSTIIWGISTPVAKLALVDWPPLFQAWIRFAIALAVLIPWLLMKRQRIALGRGPALLGLLGVGLFYALHNVGLQRTSAINSSLILDGGTPILTVLLAALVLNERPQRPAVLGLIASFAGVAAVIVGANRAFGSVGYGELIMLASAALWAAYSIIGRRIFAAGGVLPVVAGSTLYGAIFLAPAAGYEGLQRGMPSLSAGGVSLLLFLGVGCSALAYILVGFALTHLPAWQVAALSTVMPLVSLVAAGVIWREPVDTSQVAGGLLILSGLVLCTPRRSTQTTMTTARAAT